MSKIKNIIGNYDAFFSDLLQRMKNCHIDITGMPLSHLLYRTATLSEYENLRDKLKVLCNEFVETQFNDRAVSILILKEPLLLEDSFTVSMIELPAPRPVHRYPSGLESIGVIVGKTLPAFINQYHDILTGVKDHGQNCQPAYITFDNNKTAKFYDISLREIVILQGWQNAEAIKYHKDETNIIQRVSQGEFKAKKHRVEYTKGNLIENKIESDEKKEEDTTNITEKIVEDFSKLKM